ncbi:hypothetical protein TEA_022182 [Camellia sinensis var. sinensis]|uniref:CSN8/PSMD8/EIF3K domain-containing protein n=1 Tax=Camellia sinensis var. sinensis TaxID=542762 RepID=A0A4V3WRA6_CAMSN|nr:hypothetical protein TEA_022182 [Camellia sinensis var. sinensis]
MPRERVRCPSENRNNSGEEVPISEKKTLRFNGSLSLGHNYVNDMKAGPQVVAREARDVVASFSVNIQDTALLLGMNDDDATNYVLQWGWSVDSISQMLTVKSQSVVTEQKLDPSKLQQILKIPKYARFTG